jgi:hypothetical protein
MADIAPGYGLTRPTVADVLVAVHRAHGPGATTVWTTMLARAGLAGHETDDDALRRLLDALAGLDPVSRISARSLRIRLNTYDNLTAGNRYVAGTTTATDTDTAGSIAS